MKAFPVNIRFTNDRVYLNCYFPMPFFKSARIDLVGADHAVNWIQWNVRYMPLSEPANQLSYFHATYRDFPRPTSGHDLLLLDTRTTEGGGDWSGQIVGTSFIFSHDANLRTLEGDPRFFFDDSLTPQAQGTGTEEWAGGGDYWGGLNMTLPFVGHPVGARSPQLAANHEDKIESDVFEIGNITSEKKHGYSSPQASAPYTITSRYEWGVDHLGGKEIYPAETDRGRTTKGASEFRLRLRPENFGVLLRRKLDYSFPNQRAEVYVADEPKRAWKPAGIWYLAGSNTCVYSNPREEFGATQHIVETSNRRFRDDEFLISRELTQGRKRLW